MNKTSGHRLRTRQDAAPLAAHCRQANHENFEKLATPV